MNRSFLSSYQWKIWCLAVALFGMTACQSAPARVESGNLEFLPRTITVVGKGDVSIPTTIAQVRLGVEIQGKTAQEVQQQVARRSQSVVELLKSRQVEKLETTGINLNPNYTYKDGKQTINGYSGINTVSFRIATEKSGPLLDEAIKAGATRIDGISFVASDEAIATAQQQAIEEAVGNAKTQADAALSALKVKSKEVIGIQINAANPPQPLNMPMPTAAVQEKIQANSDTPVVGGEQKVQQAVTLQIRY
ncbi:MAG TPA: hypothetical protein DDZ80_11885 [Cyanobacteria bacterium UBA8803]|nr:hypothetical protein [Cyanobacteria bacterium UBA9273]HBL59183.1 hypothetical protein [Cyanobacteria bacterium UBA8803]